MKSNQDKKRDFLSIKDIAINLIWLSKYTIIFTLSCFIIYFFINKDILIFDLLTTYGFIMLMYAGMMKREYVSGYSGYDAYKKPEYDRKKNIPSRERYISEVLLYGLKGILVMIIGLTMLSICSY